MIKECIKNSRVRNPEVLTAMRAIPRELFVPENARFEAFEDRPLSIGFGQTISQPSLVGFMTELLKPRKNQRVLEIGTGSGYQTAVLSRLVAEVCSIEIIPELARSAAERLSKLGCFNVCIRQGDGYEGWPEKAPFDGIILTAAPPEIPQVLIDELKPNALLVAPIGVEVQKLFVVHKSPDGTAAARSVLWVNFVPMTR